MAKKVADAMAGPNVEKINPNEIRFSQSSVNGSSEITESMMKGMNSEKHMTIFGIG